MTSVLIQRILENQKKIQSNRSKYSTGMGAEPKIRTDLVFPILAAIGWTVDTNSVEVEYELDSGIADLVLNKEEPVFVIETKALGKGIGSESGAAIQLLDYMIDLDLHYGSTTDGARWILYSRSGRRAKLEWKIDLLRDTPAYCERLLMQLSSGEITAIDANLTNSKKRYEVISETWEHLRNNNEDLIKYLSQILKERVEAAIPDIGEDEIEHFITERYSNRLPILSDGKIDNKPPITQIPSKVRPKKEATKRRTRDGETESSPTYWLTPVRSTSKETAEEHLQWLVGEDKLYAYGDRTPGRKKLKPGDWLCFYASGKRKGVVGHAMVSSKPVKRTYAKLNDPQKYPWIFKVDNVSLYLDNPVYLDGELLPKLSFFKNREIDAYWGTYVVTTRRITKQDFKLLTR